MTPLTLSEEQRGGEVVPENPTADSAKNKVPPVPRGPPPDTGNSTGAGDTAVVVDNPRGNEHLNHEVTQVVGGGTTSGSSSRLHRSAGCMYLIFSCFVGPS